MGINFGLGKGVIGGFQSPFLRTLN